MPNHRGVDDSANGNNERPDVVVPTGYDRIESGYLEAGDLLWNNELFRWEKERFALPSAQPVKDFWAVSRKRKEINWGEYQDHYDNMNGE